MLFNYSTTNARCSLDLALANTEDCTRPVVQGHYPYHIPRFWLAKFWTYFCRNLYTKKIVSLIWYMLSTHAA